MAFLQRFNPVASSIAVAGHAVFPAWTRFRLLYHIPKENSAL